jgi:hypothetical protein
MEVPPKSKRRLQYRKKVEVKAWNPKDKKNDARRRPKTGGASSTASSPVVAEAAAAWCAAVMAPSPEPLWRGCGSGPGCSGCSTAANPITTTASTTCARHANSTPSCPSCPARLGPNTNPQPPSAARRLSAAVRAAGSDQSAISAFLRAAEVDEHCAPGRFPIQRHQSIRICRGVSAAASLTQGRPHEAARTRLSSAPQTRSLSLCS